MFMYRDTIQSEKHPSQSAAPDESHRNFAAHDDLVVNFPLENTDEVHRLIAVIL